MDTTFTFRNIAEILGIVDTSRKNRTQPTIIHDYTINNSQPISVRSYTINGAGQIKENTYTQSDYTKALEYAEDGCPEQAFDSLSRAKMYDSTLPNIMPRAYFVGAEKLLDLARDKWLKPKENDKRTEEERINGYNSLVNQAREYALKSNNGYLMERVKVMENQAPKLSLKSRFKGLLSKIF